jgi:hypothetical protein
MPVTVRGTDILFSNGTTQSTAAVSASTEFGGIGSYAVLIPAVNSNLAQGATIAGSSLRHSVAGNSINAAVSRVNNSTYNGGGTALSGTWRKMSMGDNYLSTVTGESQYGVTTTYYWFGHLFVRIS